MSSYVTQKGTVEVLGYYTNMLNGNSIDRETLQEILDSNTSEIEEYIKNNTSYANAYSSISVEVDDVEIIVTVEVDNKSSIDPGEPRTWDYPGSPAEFEDMLEESDILDDIQDCLVSYGLSFEDDKCIINDSSLDDYGDLMEKWEENERAEYESAMELRADMERDDYYRD